MRNETCINCHGNRLRSFIDLGCQPNGNTYPSAESRQDEPRYPCVMLVCEQCWQVQLEEFPSAEVMFSDHPYITGLNRPVVDHLEQLARDVIKRFSLPENSLVFDIGANDGTLLTCFREQGMRVLGMDPCGQVNRLSRENGVTVLQSFWNRDTAAAMQRLGIHPDIITATAVFYHVDDLHGFIEGLASLMQGDSVFCVQSVYLKDIVEKAQFDHFYHEHIMIHAIGPLQNAFSRHGMKLLDVDFYPVHGGSFVLYVAREESGHTVSANIASAIEEENASGLYQLSTYHRFADVVQKNRQALLQLLKTLKAQGATIYGLGAPVKGNTLLNYYGIRSDLVSCLTEINPEKIGRLAPGSHIPIVDETALEHQPDYYLVLSWNYLDYMIDKYSYFLDNGGRFIVPHPEVAIIGRDGREAVQ